MHRPGRPPPKSSIPTSGSRFPTAPTRPPRRPRTRPGRERPTRRRSMSTASTSPARSASARSRSRRSASASASADAPKPHPVTDSPPARLCTVCNSPDRRDGEPGNFDDDAALVKALVARDAAAFEYLLDHYQAQLVRLALQYVPSRAVAEEVVQETW